VGIFLKGTGDGSFTALEPAQSGIVVPGNARALVLLDPDGDARPGLFLTQHGGQSEFLAPQATSSRWLRLRLQGTKGNPDAIGARVQLVLANGTKTHHEIGLGGGWLSQSALGIFIANRDDARVTETIIHWPGGEISRHRDVPAQGSWLIAR
jgi:hypothetical protein